MKNNNEILSISLFTISTFILISLIQFDEIYNITDIYDLIFLGDSKEIKYPVTGPLGASLSALLKKYFLGHGSFTICSILFMYSFLSFTQKDYKHKQYKVYSIYQLLFGLWLAVFFAWNESSNLSSSSGIIGFILHDFLESTISNFLYILMPVSLIMLLKGIFNISLYDLQLLLFNKSKILFQNFKKNFKHDAEINQLDDGPILNDDDDNTIESDENKINVFSEENNEENEMESIDENDIIIEEEESINESNIDKINKTNYDKYKLPPSNLLDDPVEITNTQSEDDLKGKAVQLVHALETFGVQGEVTRISPGPVITLFEIEPAEGVRVNKFTTLADDLARVMQAQRIRIIAPIPGSRSVGVELPNDNPQIVYLKTILNSEQYVNSESKLSIAIGKTTTGNAFTIELNKMPHLLVAGATGAGKSVCINTIIMSILYKAKPDEVKFVLIDPKKLELSTYKQLVGYHLITSPNLDEYVMTTAETSVGILDAAIHEMERRFSVFADAGVRNIEEYHTKQKNEDLEKVPYVVVLIDELADLMMTSSRAIEDPITRLAQKARAVGIHLVVATQRPSVDVITGLIKSNFPARISFQVSSRVDSRTIIDQMGAEKLLGKGDMLFLSPGSASPVRLHNAFITLDEIEKVLTHINMQPKPDEIKLPEAQTISNPGDSKSINSDHDELLEEAARLVIDTGQASVSLLQRRFRIGYSRAGRLIDELESLGIVSGHSGSKARDILVDHSYIENIFEK
tara:strand:+ start:11048 stop:13282 length:2235 start_codon:yes stop_codon:yes gene_type:complete